MEYTDKTQLSIQITEADIDLADKQYEARRKAEREASDELDRFIGTYLCYGAYPIIRPDLSDTAKQLMASDKKSVA